LKKNTKGLDVKILNIAIADFDGESTYYYHIDHPGGSSLIHPSDRKFGNPKKNKRNKSYTVKCKRLITVLGLKQPIGLMSIDAEDMDTRILKDMIKSNIRPHVVIAEGRSEEAKNQQRALMAKSYDFVETVGSNSIFTIKQ
jgi:FkbM family methyltransferase